ncbi:hypothetical protein [Sphaerobacter sp.]|uniref:DUF7144 family membrane protein n=1 Tax=Sphaerobacter sp. TaxID=2099654 RepID=UPI001D37BA4D|nr:hypothetical protein [Sphaerobacter sp.]MBX5444921.1 hypothetical protein [Sphaerobacter sp.]
MFESEKTPSWARGFVLFAAVMLIIIGVFHAFNGLSAILEDAFFVVTPNYLFSIDVTTWGWLHLILGIIVLLAGVYLLRGSLWAVLVGIVVAGVSAILNFLSIPYYPFWSLLIIALDVVVIWALATHGRDLAT